MKFLNKSKKRIASTIFLTIFAAAAVVGFIRPLFASEISGTKLIMSKQTIDDPTATFALLDSNFIEGGHMQVPTISAMLGNPVDHIPGFSSTSTSIVYVTPDRRKVGMLVTVLDPAGDGSMSPATYRLIHNESQTSDGTTDTCHQLSTTDRSADGLKYNLHSNGACQLTQLGDWAVVIPAINNSMAAGQYILVATRTASSSSDYQFALVPNTGGGGSGISSLTASGTAFSTLMSFSSIGGAMTFNLQTTLAGYVFAGPSATSGLPLFRALVASDLPLIDLSASSTMLSGPLATKWGGLGGDFSTTTVGSLLYASGDGHFLSLGIGTAGQILTVQCDSFGVCTPVWGDQNGGLFPSAGDPITAGWSGLTGTTVGSTSTTLSQFIQNVFFPALAPTISLTGGNTYEWGSTTYPKTLTVNITKRTKTNSVTAVSLSASIGSIASLLFTDLSSTLTGTTATGTDTFYRIFSGLSSVSTSTATFTLSVTSTSTGISVPSAYTTVNFLPAVYYGKSFDNLMDSSTFPNDGATTTGSLNNKIQNLLAHSPKANRNVNTGLYSNSSTTAPMWVYFAWPSYLNPTSDFINYEPDSVVSGSDLTANLGPNACKAVYGDGTGHNSYDDSGPGTACFQTGTDISSVHPDSSFKHRTVDLFVNSSGVPIPYELYQSESFLSLTGPSTIVIQVQ